MAMTAVATTKRAQWGQIKRLLIYAYIYEGTPDWASTEAVVTIHTPTGERVEVRLGADANPNGFCVVASIDNINGEMTVTRQVYYCQGQQPADHALRWGMSWVTARK